VALGAGEVIGAYRRRVETTGGEEDASSRILEMVRRRPCTAEDLRESLGIAGGLIEEALEELVASGRIQGERLARGMFYKPL